jgi:excisionase family DNA binding protein
MLNKPMLLTIPEAAEALRLSVPTTERLIARGALRKVKQGRRVFVRPGDLYEYVESLTDDPTPIRKV